MAQSKKFFAQIETKKKPKIHSIRQAIFNPAFSYNHMTHDACDFEGEMSCSRSESVRAAVEHQVEDYVKAHYPNGSTSIYGTSNGNTIEITVCIEDHEFQSRNHWGGRWPRTGLHILF